MDTNPTCPKCNGEKRVPVQAHVTKRDRLTGRRICVPVENLFIPCPSCVPGAQDNLYKNLRTAMESIE